MAGVRASKDPFEVVAYRGDARTLLAWDLTTAASRKRLAGFTIRVQPPGPPSGAYHLYNKLTFAVPSDHAQNPAEPTESSVNSPLHRFRWVHHPGLYHQDHNAVMGTYQYTVTPRYFSTADKLLPIDPTLGATVSIPVDRYVKGKVAVGFTRGYVQSQAFLSNFGLDQAGKTVRIAPSKAGLLWDTTVAAGVDPDGKPYTYDDQHRWLGFTARDRLFQLLDDVLAKPTQSVDIFAYDLDDPGFAKRVLALAKAKRARVILDDDKGHHDKVAPADPAKVKAEDAFQALFEAQRPGFIKRGHFSGLAHDKVIVVYDGNGAKRVLTGSTNFSTSGLVVNSNHVLVFEDRAVARMYRDVFQAAWDGEVKGPAFKDSGLANTPFPFGGNGVPTMSITFSPHDKDFAGTLLGKIATRVDGEHSTATTPASVLFAVMGIDNPTKNPLYATLQDVHQRTDVFSYGITDTAVGVELYEPGRSTGVLVTGRGVKSIMPPPFNQVPGIGSFHQVHHKFVVCGVKGSDPTVWCGSSNLAFNPEQENGDNLLEIHDADIAMVFAIEALELIDHFEFLHGQSVKEGLAPSDPAPSTPPTTWHLGVTDAWVAKYFDPSDLHHLDRRLWIA